MKATRMAVVAVVIVASGLVLNVARAQQAGKPLPTEVSDRSPR